MYRLGILLATLLTVVLGGEEDDPPTSGGRSMAFAGTFHVGYNLPSPMESMETCLFDRFPRLSCRIRCYVRDSEPYCDQELKRCLCREVHEEDKDSQDLFDVPKTLQSLFKSPQKDESVEKHAQSEDESSDSRTTHINVGPHITISVTPARPGAAEAQKERNDPQPSFHTVDLNKVFGNKTESTLETPPTTAFPSTDTDKQPTPDTPTPAGWTLEHILAMLVVILLLILSLLELHACFKMEREHGRVDTVINAMPVISKA